jgi:hypothetical protein
MTALKTLITFNGTDGESPSGTIVADQQGDLFGIVAGGINDSVYELPFTDGSYAASPTTIANFAEATNPLHLSFDLAIDSQGNLFGAIEEGGDNSLAPYSRSRRPTAAMVRHRRHSPASAARSASFRPAP